MELLLILLIALPLVGLLLANAGLDLFRSQTEVPYYEREKHERLKGYYEQREAHS